MLDGILFDKLDQIGRTIRRVPSLPFGGIQVVLAGVSCFHPASLVCSPLVNAPQFFVQVLCFFIV